MCEVVCGVWSASEDGDIFECVVIARGGARRCDRQSMCIGKNLVWTLFVSEGWCVWFVCESRLCGFLLRF